MLVVLLASLSLNIRKQLEISELLGGEVVFFLLILFNENVILDMLLVWDCMFN